MTKSALMLLTLVAVALGLLWPRLAAWMRGRSAYLRLAEANALTPRQRRWLWQLARRVCPEQPALVFVRPSLFEESGVAGYSPLALEVRKRLFG